MNTEQMLEKLNRLPFHVEIRNGLYLSWWTIFIKVYCSKTLYGTEEDDFEFQAKGTLVDAGQKILDKVQEKGIPLTDDELIKRK